ncbi:zinc-binding alcohol dehydrogenase family protein [Aeoliella mucimassa]|uniref:Putative zinc-type alcohol dehydrogenase-like protein YjmD n=1 Tax=Aeoliella mucimassa TaxID=2527972 RepID=A0A518AQH6_9BACT|nr:zinc-binding alcohol dehydrogenase family protein [Aeoliella mucimassa]QDU56973.1 putative zinc-type alcohol dehydrogenase-like protein YjmD [Aeoliella mucimassa]
MRALQITAPGECRLVELEVPSIHEDQVLLRVATVGYCGSDLNTFRGLNPLVSYPRVPGHELSGVVAEVGASVTEWQIGEQALVFPYTECGECAACLADRPNCCQHNQTLGVQREGALAEYIALPPDKLMRADGLSFAELALVEPLTVGFHAAARGKVGPDDRVLVFGAGAIGLGAIAGACFRGARVMAVDIDDAKIEIARACGACETVNSSREPLDKRVADWTSGHGANVVIEAVGVSQTFVAAIDLVSFAGRVVYIGYAKSPVEYDTKWFVMKELDIRGSRNALPSDFADVIELLQSGRFPTDRVISHRGSLDQAPGLLQAWAESPREFTKIQIDLNA